MVAAAPRTFPETVERLSAHSVTKHFDAFADIEWDAPENRIHPDDPRFAVPDSHPLGGTAWYQNLPPSRQAQLGLHLTVHQMKTGVVFENVLSRGLLEFAASRADGAPELRYAYHEVIEESQHSLMFQEFVNRSGMHVPGPTGVERWFIDRIPKLGRRFPELFFFFVLGGEAPIDASQKNALRQEREKHPLLERIMRIHVLEEARHLCFANGYLDEHMPKVTGLARLHMQIRVPFVLHLTARQMLDAPAHVVRSYGIPRAVVREAYRNDEAHRASIREGLAPVVDVARRTGVLTPTMLPLWQKLDLVKR